MSRHGAGMLIVAILTITGCGGSDDETDETDASPTAPATPAATSPPSPPATEVSPTQALPTSSSPPSEPTVGTAPPPSPTATPVTAPTDERLALRIPVVDGFEVRDVPADDLLWRFVDVPTTFKVHHGVVHGLDGERVARIVVASGPSIDPPIEAYVASSFDPFWQFPRDTAAADDGVNTLVLTNPVTPRWTDVEGAAVLVGTLPETAVTQWAWGADDLVWIVRGESGAEPFVTSILAQHVAALDAFDTQGMTGRLWDHTPSLDGYTYRDLPRADTLAALPFLLVPDCVERAYVGYLKEVDAVDIMLASGDLQLALVKVGGECVRGGYLDEIRSAIATQPGWTPSTIAGRDVLGDPNDLVLMVGDVVIHLRSDDPTTFTELAATIEQFVAGQPATS